MSFLPAEKLGIVVLTNGWQIGLPEAVASTFLDLAEQARVTRDWLATFAPLIALSRQNTSRLLGRTRPPVRSPPAPPRSTPGPTTAASTDGPGS